MTYLEQLLAALAALETTGSGSVGPLVNTNTVTIFGQRIEVTETVSVAFKKV